jgi:uncharacterized membrane protein YraQ (UPF0718 family)
MQNLVLLCATVIAGLLISGASWGKVIEKEQRIEQTSSSHQVAIVKPPLDEGSVSALKFGGYLVKQIIPFFVVCMIAVSYVEAFLPEELVQGYLTGVPGILLASVVGGPLHTPTLVEIVLGRSLLQLGMPKAALLSSARVRNVTKSSF